MLLLARTAYHWLICICIPNIFRYMHGWTVSVGMFRRGSHFTMVMNNILVWLALREMKRGETFSFKIHPRRDALINLTSSLIIWRVGECVCVYVCGCMCLYAFKIHRRSVYIDVVYHSTDRRPSKTLRSYPRATLWLDGLSLNCSCRYLALPPSRNVSFFIFM